MVSNLAIKTDYVDDMRSSGFDTHAAIKKLQEKGISEEQAEGIILAIWDSKQFNLSNLVSKGQFALLQQEVEHIKQQILEIKTNMSTKQDIAYLKEEFVSSRAENQVELANIRTESKADFAQARAESKEGFDKLSARIDQARAESKIDFAEVWEKVATKKDLEAAVLRFESYVAVMVSKFEASQLHLKNEMLIYLAGFCISILGMIAALFFNR